IGVATFWILLCILSINVLGTQQSLFSTNLGAAAPESMEGLGTTEAIPSESDPESKNDSTETPADAKTPTGENAADAPNAVNPKETNPSDAVEAPQEPQQESPPSSSEKTQSPEKPAE
ncbi:MAG: hypothetical protein HOH16_07255, partial [Planctomycetaceae bacterium]|nr:hypothetical protein [Planctomycetaceae bacterium]